MIKVGIVGCGYWGSKHLRVFNELAETTVVAVCDPDLRRLEMVNRYYPLAFTTREFDELLACDIEAVVIATPARTHFSLAKKALLHDKSVLVEKPFTTSAREALELIQLAEQRVVTLAVGHTFLYHPAVRMLKKLMTDGTLGDLLHIHSARLNFGLLQPDVDVLWDLAPHDISILLYLLDQNPVAVGAHGVGCFDARRCEVAHADLLFPDDVSAHLHVSWLDPSKVRKVTIVGCERMVIYDDVAPGEPLRVYDRQIKFSRRDGSTPRYPPAYSFGDVWIPQVAGTEPLKEECTDFLRSVREGGRPISDGWAGLQVVHIIECLEKSLRNGNGMETVASIEGRRTESSKPAVTAVPSKRGQIA